MLLDTSGQSNWLWKRMLTARRLSACSIVSRCLEVWGGVQGDTSSTSWGLGAILPCPEGGRSDQPQLASLCNRPCWGKGQEGPGAGVLTLRVGGWLPSALQLLGCPKNQEPVQRKFQKASLVWGHHSPTPQGCPAE